jgi:endonuclease YncB( thermonuclease family)
VIRVRGGLNVNVRLVAVGAAALYFYRGYRGRYMTLLGRHARARRLGLWGACPGTPIDRRAASRRDVRGPDGIGVQPVAADPKAISHHRTPPPRRA